MPADELFRWYRAVRAFTEGLAAPLSAEDQQIQPMPDASPTKWHLAHTTWFFETFVLQPHVPGYRVFDPRFGFLFNSYYDSLGDRVPRARRGLLSRPSLAEVHAFRRHVDDEIANFFESGVSDPARELITLGLHHEQQHQELILTDIKYTLMQNPLRSAYQPPADQPRAASDVPAVAWHPFPEGLAEIGHAGGEFAFDNEGPRHQVFLRAFELASRVITCGEFMDFVSDGGYRRPELWLSDGWASVKDEGWRAPLYWEQRDDSHGGWLCFTLGGMRAVDPAEPVAHVSYYEADAYARWAGARLATEAEWEIAAREAPRAGTFAESRAFHPKPLAAGAGVTHPKQLFGDVWQWTASPYVAYPGFVPAPGAVGEYNGKFMCNQIVLRGGSCATPESHIRATYRNFFPPAARWQFAGIRLARDAS